jgi:hypothetical protein
VRQALHLLVLAATVIWLAWNAVTWHQAVSRRHSVVAAELTRDWPRGRRLQELQDRIEQAQRREDARLGSTAILRAGAGLIVLRLVAMLIAEGKRD